MPFTQAQIDALKAAIATGTRSVAYSDRTVVYQTIADMLAALTAMEADLAGDSASGMRTTFAAPRRD